MTPAADQLCEMREIAFRMGMAFGREAEQADDMKDKLALFELYQRCFFSVRVAIALELRVRREQAAPPERPVREAEETLELEAAEAPDAPERPERYTERDRDRDVERASFPLLLRSLEGVAAAAARLPGPPPAELPTLRELLARVSAQPTLAAARPQPASPLRARLSVSGAVSALTPPRPAGLHGAAPRPATGPP